MDDRIKRSLELIEEWDGNQNPSGNNDINTLYELREILSEKPETVPDGEQALLLENVAILSADFHTHRNYHPFYQKFGPELGGFPGIYRLVIDMARTMTDWEKRHGGSEAFEVSTLSWPEASERFVDAVISRSLKEKDLSSFSDLEDIFQDLMEEEFDPPSPR